MVRSGFLFYIESLFVIYFAGIAGRVKKANKKMDESMNTQNR